MEGRLIKKTPVIKRSMREDGDEVIGYSCPTCSKMLLSTKSGSANGCKKKYCCNCGQELTWKGIKIETYWPYGDMEE